MSQKIKKAQSLNALIMSGTLSQSEWAAKMSEFIKIEAYVAKYGTYDDLAKCYLEEKS